MSAAQQKWEVERNMRRHWERLDRLQSNGGGGKAKGKRLQHNGTLLSSWQPGELTMAHSPSHQQRQRLQQNLLKKVDNA